MGSQDSRLLLGIADRQGVLECLDGVQDNFGKLVERWNDLLTFETCNIAEQYINNRLALVLDVKLGSGRHPYHMYYAVRPNDSGAVLHADTSCSCRHFDISIEIHQLAHTEHGDQEDVLVGNINTVQYLKKRIPSRIIFYPIGEQRNNVVGSLQYSLTERVCKFLPIFPDPEIGVFARRFPNSCNQYNLYSQTGRPKQEFFQTAGTYVKAGGAVLGLASIPVSAYQGYQQGGPLSAAQSVGYSAIDAAVNFTLATSAVGIPVAVAYTQSGGSKAMLSGAQVGVAMQACAGSFSFAPGG